MTNDYKRLRDYEENDVNDSLQLGCVRLANQETTPIFEYGKLVRWKNVLYVPELDADIVLSVGLLANRRYKIVFEKNCVNILSERDVPLIHGYKNKDNLYLVSNYRKADEEFTLIAQPDLDKTMGIGAKCRIIKRKLNISSTPESEQDKKFL